MGYDVLCQVTLEENRYLKAIVVTWAPNMEVTGDLRSYYAIVIECLNSWDKKYYIGVFPIQVKRDNIMFLPL